MSLDTEAIRGLAAELHDLNATLIEQNRTSRRRLLRATVAAVLASAAVLGVGVVMILGMYEIKHLGHLQFTETLRREHDVLDHQLKQERCVVRVLNEVLEKRINNPTGEPIALCDPEPAIASLERRAEVLKGIIAEREAAYEQEERPLPDD